MKSMARSQSARVSGMMTPLPAANPSALMTTGNPKRLGKLLRGRGFAKAAIGGGRNVVRRAEVFHEALGAFQHRARRARPQRLDARRLQPVPQPRHQRRFRPDHHEVDLFLSGEGHQPVEIRRGDGHALGHLRDPGIARRAIELRDAAGSPTAPRPAHVRGRRNR